MPEDDEIWCNFLRLLDIIDAIFTPLCSEENVAHLGHMIELYLLDFKDLHSQESIIPKMHYLVHYPALIMRYVHTHNSMMGNQSAYRYCGLQSSCNFLPRSNHVSR